MNEDELLNFKKQLQKELELVQRMKKEQPGGMEGDLKAARQGATDLRATKKNLDFKNENEKSVEETPGGAIPGK